MIRYEASLEGNLIIGEPFTNFNEKDELEKVFNSARLDFEPIDEGRGGYYIYEIKIENVVRKVHVYLKRITFGGRENLPYEKRVQFSAAIDRGGFIIAQNETSEEFSLILGIYKYNDSDNTVICAWDIHDWGHNFGRAFNCFVSVKEIASAFKDGFSQHKSSKGQIVCCFKPDKLLYYFDNRRKLHEQMIISSKKQLLKFINLTDADNSENYYSHETPKFSELFQLVIDILKDHNGVCSTKVMEEDASKMLNLTEEARIKVHNKDEGDRTELGYQLAWSRLYLKKALLVENNERSIWSLTDLGWNSIINRNEIIKIATRKEIQIEINEESRHLIVAENDIEEDKEIDSYQINKPFDPNKVDIRTRTMSLDLILKRLKTEAIDMQTSFQRKPDLWNLTKQSRLIESILVKFPLPAFYFDGSDDSKWLVVDGLQRLSTLDNFVNEESFTLRNLEFLDQYNGSTFSALPSYLQRRIEEFEITSYVIAAGTPKILKFNVFKRINTGGLTLNSQEIRNALYQGDALKFVKKLSELRSFKLATGYTISEDRMIDQEFINRFLAFYIFELDDYESDLDGFLNRALDELNNNKNRNLSSIKDAFDNAMKAMYEIFEDDAFRKRYNVSDKKKPINRALFEVWSVLLSKLTSPQINTLINNGSAVRQKFMFLLNTDTEFNKAITSGTADKARVRKRFSEIRKILKLYIS